MRSATLQEYMYESYTAERLRALTNSTCEAEAECLTTVARNKRAHHDCDAEMKAHHDIGIQSGEERRGRGT
eukprot:1049566-Pyramimonas_sp.AAC.1